MYLACAGLSVEQSRMLMCYKTEILPFLGLCYQYSPQGVCGDGHDALWTLLRGKARGKLQSLI